MAEIKAYGFLIGTEECFRRRNELIYDTKKVKGFLGISPEPHGYGQVLLFDNIDNRNKAMRYFKGLYQSVRKIATEIYFDEKYLTEEGKATPEELLGNDDFGKMLKELLADAEKNGIEKAKEECAKEINSAKNQLSLWKGKVSELEQENLRLKLQVKDIRSAKMEIEKSYEKTIKALNKEIKSLEADLKRLEKENLMGELK